MIILETISNTKKTEIYGNATDKPQKWGFNQKRTIYGEQIQEYTGTIINKVTLNVDYCNEESKNNIYDMWTEQLRINCISDTGKIYSGILIVDESFGLEEKYDDDGNIYYAGTINLES